MESTQNRAVPPRMQPPDFSTNPQQPPQGSTPVSSEAPSTQSVTQEQPQPLTQDSTNTTSAQSSQYQTPTSPEESVLIPGMTKPQKEEVLLEWQAPSRPFKKHNRQYYSTVGVIAGLIGLILFFAGQIIPVAVVFAVVFLTYVMNSISPGKVVNKLTTYGIRVEDELYYWDELGRFWIKEKYGVPVLYIEVFRFPNRLTILLGDLRAEDMQLILSEVLLNEEPPPTSYEKAARWLHQKVPIDLET